MLTLRKIIQGFLKGILDSKIALLGTIITVVLFPVLVIYAILEGLEIIENPQLGFIVYGALTWIFIAGHLLVFTGLFLVKKKTGSSLFAAQSFREHFTASRRFKSLRKIILFVSFITFFNFLVIGITAYNGFHYFESVNFCVRLCHTVMMPEYTAYENSPHSRVACVECHIGSGAKWFVKSKLSGARQLVAVVLDTYSQPIITPIHGLRPARDTCEECHRPELFHGERLRKIDKFLEDEENTHVQTILLLKVGSGDYRGQRAKGIHWHVSKKKKIMFKHLDWKREKISEVRLIKEDMSEVVFKSNSETDAASASDEAEVREMDCLDCHNRPTHIYQSPDEAINLKIVSGEISRDLPYIKRQGLEVVSQEYDSHLHAESEISRQLLEFYNENYPEIFKQQRNIINRAIKAVVLAYTENVFPEMKIGYGTYKNYMGHRDDTGCFRCHDDLHEDKDGNTISQDCETCHLILAEDEPPDNNLLR